MKPLPLDTVRCLTSDADITFFRDGVRPTTTYYMKTLDVKSP